MHETDTRLGWVDGVSGTVVTVQGPPDDDAAELPLTATHVLPVQETAGEPRKAVARSTLTGVQAPLLSLSTKTCLTSAES